MVTVILLVLALFVLQTLLPNRFREPAGPGEPSDAAYSMGPRDQPRPLTLLGGRAARALANLQEALPVFLTLALLNLILGTAAATATLGGWIFLVARAAYLPAYLSGVPALRSLIWMGSWAGLVLMLLPVLHRTS